MESSMSSLKMTLGLATMLHSQLPITPTWRALSGGETWTDPQGGYPSGCRLIDGGS
jgi:hypothetical protein